MTERGDGLPPCLQEFVDRIIKFITDQEKLPFQNGIPPPGLWDYVFWPHDPTIVAVKAEDLAPERFLRMPLIVWHPTLFWRRWVPKIPCPKCKSCDNVSSNGWGAVRRCFGLNHSALFIGKKFICKSESCIGKRSFTTL